VSHFSVADNGEIHFDVTAPSIENRRVRVLEKFGV
jgi:hypothetical protein